MKQRLGTGRIPSQLGVDASAVVVVAQGETYLVRHETHRLRAAHEIVRLSALRQETRQDVEHTTHRLRAGRMDTRRVVERASVRCKVSASSKRMRVKRRITRGVA